MTHRLAQPTLEPLEDRIAPFATFGPGFAWPQPGGPGTAVNVTYSYGNLLSGLQGGLTQAQIRAAIEEALSLWARVAPLHFTEVPDSGPPNPGAFEPPATQIRFVHDVIDGRGGAVGFAGAPSTFGSEVTFDTAEAWTIGQTPATSVDLLSTAVHEIGHALGLNHEPAPPAGNRAVMNPSGGALYTGLGTGYLLPDDVNGIQSIYGAGTGSVNPATGLGLPDLRGFRTVAQDAVGFSWGGTVTLTEIQVQNAGNATSASFINRFYLSLFPEWSSGAILLNRTDGGGNSLGFAGIAAGGLSPNVSLTFQMPTLASLPSGWLTQGIYYIVMRTDALGHVLESNENNNSGQADPQRDSDDIILTDLPGASITPVTPNPRGTPVSAVNVVFSKPVTGVDLTDLALRRNGGANLLTAAQTLTTTDNLTWTLNNLDPLTAQDGTYTLTLNAASSGIVDQSNNGLINDASTSWVTQSGTPPPGGAPVVGTEENDLIFVNTTFDNMLSVTLNGQVVAQFDPGTVASLTIEGRGGNDQIEVAPDVMLSVSVLGGAGNDTIIGGAGHDTILGGSGDDQLFGRGGNDQMFGEAGNDSMDGQEGNDSLGGGSENDLMFGSAGNDLMFGEAGNDGMDGGEGNDNVDGGGDNDFMFGSGGNDLLFGGDGNDSMDGGLGNDSMDGGAGDDVMFGLDGTDVMYGLAGNDSMDGGAGDDFMDGSLGNDLIFGSFGNDLIFGGAGNDAIDGNDGNDSIDAADGDDLIFGSGGNDLIFAGLGNDSVDGGPGLDGIDGGPGVNLIFN